jgi:hypothetical protein
MATTDTEKWMISIIWSISAIHSLMPLSEALKYKDNSQYYCQPAIADSQNSIPAFLQKSLNPQQPKEYRAHLIAEIQNQVISFSVVI